MNGTIAEPRLRRQLLTTASAAVLCASLCSPVAASDTDNPIVWIEVGAQYDRTTGSGGVFAPSFTTPWSNAVFEAPQRVEHMPPFSFGGDASLTFQPEQSDWVFTGAVRFGRSSAHRLLHQQSALPPTDLVPSYPTLAQQHPSFAQYNIPIEKFAETHANVRNSYAILDFQAGKDMGLGMAGSSSVLSIGVRFAQFTAKSDGTIYARPKFDITYTKLGAFRVPLKYFHDYSASDQIGHDFHGIGPSLAWKASAPLIRTAQDAGISFDWGLNGAVLFGRQKVEGHHQTTNTQYIPYYFNQHRPPHAGYVSVYHHHYIIARSRTVTVPNLGGFAGLTFRYAEAKLSVGYRADFFFGAMDDGIDSVKRETTGFYGPFATVSVGLGG